MITQLKTGILIILTGAYLPDFYGGGEGGEETLVPEALQGRMLEIRQAGKTCRLSAVLITLNEEKKLPDCLESLSFVDEITIVDSGSTDRTKEAALKYGARFSSRVFDNFSAQKNHALKQATGDWLLLIDADERISPALKQEILRTIEDPQAREGYFLRRVNYVFGAHLRFGASLGDRQLRLIRRGKGEFSRLVHERIELKGQTGILNEPLIHYTSQNMEEYLKRFHLYTTLEAKEIFRSGRKPTWYHWAIKPLVQFVYFYFFRLGFLDGVQGFQYQLHASFYTYAKYTVACDLFRNKTASA